MKRLLLYIAISLVGLQTSQVFSIQEAPREEVESTKNEAETSKSDLEHQQKELEKQIEEQKQKVEDAPEEERQAAQDKLNEMNETYANVGEKIQSLDQFINKATEEPSQVTQDELGKAKTDVEEAQKLSQQLETEFISSEPGEEKELEEAQQEVEKLGMWETFRLGITRRFKEAQATIAEFFGAKDTAAGARRDLNDIYEKLNEYGAKAANSSQLAALYKEFGQIGNAVLVQGLALDAAADEYAKTGKISDTTITTIQNAMSDVLELRDALQKGQTLDVSQKEIDDLKGQIDDFLGELGYKISAESYYEVLGIDKDSTLDQIKSSYRKLALRWHPDRNPSPEAEEQFKRIGAAYETLSDPDKKSDYDTQPIVQEGFEIKEMTPAEKEAFKQKKQQEESGQQTGILGGGG